MCVHVYICACAFVTCMCACVCVRESESERERDREIEREIEREGQRERERGRRERASEGLRERGKKRGGGREKWEDMFLFVKQICTMVHPTTVQNISPPIMIITTTTVSCGFHACLKHRAHMCTDVHPHTATRILHLCL